jgi:hypothetical protein
LLAVEAVVDAARAVCDGGTLAPLRAALGDLDEAIREDSLGVGTSGTMEDGVLEQRLYRGERLVATRHRNPDGTWPAWPGFDGAREVNSFAPTSGKVVERDAYWSNTPGWNEVVAVRFFLPAPAIVDLDGQARTGGRSTGSMALLVDGEVLPSSESNANSTWRFTAEDVPLSAGWHRVSVVTRGRVSVSERSVEWVVVLQRWLATRAGNEEDK